jgi:hypothetical protein
LIKNLNLVHIKNTQKINQEIVSEFSRIPHQLEYLIEDALGYDAYTFLEELESGRVETVLQVLLLCVLHALNVLIIYQSGRTKTLREYACRTEDSFDFKSPSGDNNSGTKFDYYAFVYKDGTSEVYTVQTTQNIESLFAQSKANSFLVEPSHPKPFPRENPMSMTYDASLGPRKFTIL